MNFNIIKKKSNNFYIVLSLSYNKVTFQIKSKKALVIINIDTAINSNAKNFINQTSHDNIKY